MPGLPSDPKPTMNTPLHWAAYAGNVELVQLLLAHKADVTLRNSEGRTPLGYAAWANRKPVVELLKTHGGKE